MSKVIDLCNHKLVLATGLQARHGVSGHTFEMIEYWWYFRQHGIDAAIMCTAHKPDVVMDLARGRYTFTESELHDLSNALVDGTDVLLARLPVVIWVDGSISYHKSATAVASAHLAFACNNTQDFDRIDLLLGDVRLYDMPCVHYIKKILFGKFKPVRRPEGKIAMLYCKTQARKVTQEYIDALPLRFDYDRFLLVTDDRSISCPPKVEIIPSPDADIMSKFSAYIYSPLVVNWAHNVAGLGDCSPRFPAECAFYGREFVVDAPVNRGLAVRMDDMKTLAKITLTADDALISYVAPYLRKFS